MQTTSFPYASDLVRQLTEFNIPLPIPMFGILVVAAFLLAIAATHIEVKRLHEAGRIGLARRRSKKTEEVSSCGLLGSVSH
jgi:phosphatidylglycerol:prolipoprotein diacylglycerol transferase